MFLAVSTPRLWTQCDYSLRLLPSFSLAGSPSGQVENNPPSILGRAAGKLSVSNAHALITETQPFIFFSPLSLLCLISELVKWAGALITGLEVILTGIARSSLHTFSRRGSWSNKVMFTYGDNRALPFHSSVPLAFLAALLCTQHTHGFTLWGLDSCCSQWDHLKACACLPNMLIEGLLCLNIFMNINRMRFLMDLYKICLT